jgi:hypothetical protein
MHGVVEGREARKFVHRNYLDRQRFETFLAECPRFGRWEAASDADVLTVDDATRAGADACRIARQFGHDVTFFINPGLVEAREPYFFASLDPLLDASANCAIAYDRTSYHLADWTSARAFRRAVKRRIVFETDAGAVRAQIAELSRLLNTEVPEPPPHLLTIDQSDVEQLLALGVRIESHGWTHVDPAGMTLGQFTEHLQRSRLWLRERLGEDARWYAVPFGESVPPSFGVALPEVWFLADSDRPPGDCGGNVWNRVTLAVGEARR